MHSVLIGGETQKRVLETAYDMRLTDGSVVFLPYDTLLYSLPYDGELHAALRNNSKLRRAYDAVLTVTLESAGESFHRAYQDAVEHGELPADLKPHQLVLMVARALQASRSSGGWVSGESLARHARGLPFSGFSSSAHSNRSGPSPLQGYSVLDTDGESCSLYPTHRIHTHSGLLTRLGPPIHFPHGAPPKPDSACWFTEGQICGGGVDPFFVLSVFLSVLLLVLILLGAAILIRRRISRIRMGRGANKILLTLADVTFINPSLSSKKMSLSESKCSDMGRCPSDADRSLKSPYSSASLEPATHENSNVVIYEGDWAWLKRLPSGNFEAIYPKTRSVFEMMKDMRHENINPFLGFFHDCGVFAVVTEFCSRGSLRDLLQNEDVKLDWMFKSSLLLDLIKGMKYLHHQGLCHGRLKSQNCVVDGRFVLKIADCGYRAVLEAQRFPYERPAPEDLLWTAPELLRARQPGIMGSQAGDVYSFSIIMQEVVTRGLPFCMLALRPRVGLTDLGSASTSQIIQRLEKPPPLCRPVVSQDHAPMECIQLMKQCWNEQPEKRPTFNEIFDQFKNVNKGKKTNIIDSMLRMLEQYSSNLEELIRERTEELEIEKQKTDKLLTQMLPPSVAEALKTGCTDEWYLTLYTLFDAIIGDHDVYKVETIGDAYMVASGLPAGNPYSGRSLAWPWTSSAPSAPSRSMRTSSFIQFDSKLRFTSKPSAGEKYREMPSRMAVCNPVCLCVAVTVLVLVLGPCVAGVVGLTMPRYCLFGDTVNTASRMESTGLPYRIHVSQSTVKILLELKQGYKVELRGMTQLEGRGVEETYWLTGKEGFTKPLPTPPVLKPGQKAHGLQMEEIARYKRRKAERQLSGKTN
ncbi:hypothetical protein GJAV_G00125160 [Gymnothorax javanicus]|nr:hypothetical protein GJAV_G00125160 [Gymnothorax javanicus]